MNTLGNRKKSSFLQILNSQRILILLILMTVAMSLTIDNFASADNLLKIARQVSVYGVLAVGMTFVIMTGGIDISVGSTLALGGIVAGMLDTMGYPLVVSIGGALIAGFIVGAINGYLVAYCKLLPFVATMGMMNLIRGLSMIISDGKAIYGVSNSFLNISAKYLWIIPVPVIIMLSIFLIGYILLKHFSGGRYILAVGGSREAAKLAGIDEKKVEASAYIISGVLSALGGVILASRLGTAQPSAGGSYELTCIASAVIGGTSLLGGTGSMAGTLWGTLILGLVASALNQLGVQAFYQTMVVGGIVIAAVLFDKLRKK